MGVGMVRNTETGLAEILGKRSLAFTRQAQGLGSHLTKAPSTPS